MEEVLTSRRGSEQGAEPRSSSRPRRGSSPGVQRSIRRSVLLALFVLVPWGGVSAQLPTSPSLRWGSGYLDVPTASILPGSGVRAVFSGFWSSVPSSPEVDGSGAVIGAGPSRDAFHGDLALSLGLLDRIEVGVSLQSFQSEDEGGDLWGAFGTLVLLRPEPGGLGLAVGARLLSRPELSGGIEGAPSRLGFNDARLRRSYEGGIEVDTRFTPWVAGTLALPGPRSRGLPESDVTLTAGWGGGTFREGDPLTWYSDGASGGWFAGASWGFAIGGATTLGFEAEYSGFDVNVGADVHWGRARIGVHGLGLKHGDRTSVYHTRRLGISDGLEA